jgi:hypothetical protein
MVAEPGAPDPTSTEPAYRLHVGTVLSNTEQLGGRRTSVGAMLGVGLSRAVAILLVATVVSAATMIGFLSAPGGPVAVSYGASP